MSHILLTSLLISHLTELRPHFSLASESDTADQEDLDAEDDHEEQPANQTVRRPHAVLEDAVATSGVSTLSSTVSHDSQSAHRSLNVQLGRMKIETNRWVLVWHGWASLSLLLCKCMCLGLTLKIGPQNIQTMIPLFHSYKLHGMLYSLKWEIYPRLFGQIRCFYQFKPSAPLLWS